MTLPSEMTLPQVVMKSILLSKILRWIKAPMEPEMAFKKHFGPTEKQDYHFIGCSGVISRIIDSTSNPLIEANSSKMSRDLILHHKNSTKATMQLRYFLCLHSTQTCWWFNVQQHKFDAKFILKSFKRALALPLYSADFSKLK